MRPILIVLGWLEGYNSTFVLMKPETGNILGEIWQGLRFPFSINFLRPRQPVRKILRQLYKKTIYYGFLSKHLKDSSIKTPLPLPYINVVGQ